MATRSRCWRKLKAKSGTDHVYLKKTWSVPVFGLFTRTKGRDLGVHQAQQLLVARRLGRPAVDHRLEGRLHRVELGLRGEHDLALGIGLQLLHQRVVVVADSRVEADRSPFAA